MVSANFTSYMRPPRARRNPKVGSGFSLPAPLRRRGCPLTGKVPAPRRSTAAAEPILRTGNMRL